MEEYQALCDRLFDNDPDVVRYTTLFAVETYKDTTKITPETLLPNNNRRAVHRM